MDRRRLPSKSGSDCPRSQGDQEDRSFDALSGLVTATFGQDVTSGHLFLFVNRRRDRLKILYWDRDGLAIWYKRLETPGSFQLPVVAPDAVSIEMSPTQLTLILSGIDLRSARQRKRYQRPRPKSEKSRAAPL
jgi:transposase